MGEYVLECSCARRKCLGNPHFWTLGSRQTLTPFKLRVNSIPVSSCGPTLDEDPFEQRYYEITVGFGILVGLGLPFFVHQQPFAELT